MKKIRLIVAGIGPHAKRVYIPALLRLKDRLDVDIALAIDLKEKEGDVRSWFAAVNAKPDFLFVDRFGDGIPDDLERLLNETVREANVDGIIISTEPLAHKPYAEWALRQRLNILMDKPITTRAHVVSDPAQADGIRQDYEELLKAYRALQVERQTVFSINAQRRYHPGFIQVLDLLKEVAAKTNCPITSILSMDCDGQWRLPSEIVTQDYHPYNSGYGKASHSGYHFFDIAYCFYKVSAITGKMADTGEVFSSFVQPRGFIYQLNQRDYERYFGEPYKQVRLYGDDELRRIYQDYGEIDAFMNFRLRKQGDIVCNASINLLHNGFARRTWLRPGLDLYKGNGRVKHEYHSIQQGPFQNIQIHSYQCNDKHDRNTLQDLELGGNNHFDIYVFRNCGMTGDQAPIRVVHMGDLAREAGYRPDELASEHAKADVVLEFLEFIMGVRPKDSLRSNIDDHAVPVRMMSATYMSHIMQKKGHNPIATFEFN